MIWIQSARNRQYDKANVIIAQALLLFAIDFVLLNKKNYYRSKNESHPELKVVALFLTNLHFIFQNILKLRQFYIPLLLSKKNSCMVINLN